MTNEEMAKAFSIIGRTEKGEGWERVFIPIGEEA